VEQELIASEVFGCRMFSRTNMNAIILDTKAISAEEETFYLLVWDFQVNRGMSQFNLRYPGQMNEQETGIFFCGEEEGE